ncbi:MAG: tetratricopeptide repeat protein [candidate division KSB1 bacterium]|nr:tetratricopeptide repeat protein [candidate division KSB1 bacterium]
MRNTITFILLFVFFTALLSFAKTQNDFSSLILQGKEKLKQAENTWQEADLLQARAFFERLITAQPTEAWLVQYYLALADYRLTTFYFTIEAQDKAKAFLDDGIEQLQNCVTSKPDFAEAHSLLGALYGNKIAVNPFSAMVLGPKSGKEMAKALELEPNNPRTHLIAGWSAYFTPKMFGGGKDKAQQYFEQAIAFFNSYQVTDPLLPNWGYEEAYTWLGMLQMENGELEAAKTNFEKALQINPDYSWVKNDLMPNLQKKLAAKK